MAGEELRGGEAAAAFALQNENPQRVTATAYDDAGLVGLQNLAGRAGERWRWQGYSIRS